MRKFRTNTVPSGKAGFTLIEAMFGVIIVGAGIAGVMLLMGSGTRVNSYGNNLATAVLLAEEVRALTDEFGFDDLGALDGDAFSPTDDDGAPIASLARYEQSLGVTYIDPDDLSAYAGEDPAVLARLVATVSLDGEELTQITWLRSR